MKREEKKIEALARMKMLGIFPETVKQFKEDELVSISELPMGAFFWADDEDCERIRQFEEDNNALVYVMIRSYTNIGKLDAFFYVSDYEEEWEMDREDIANGQAVVYVYNHDMPDCSEMGSIGFKRTAAAGLKRIW